MAEAGKATPQTWKHRIENGRKQGLEGGRNRSLVLPGGNPKPQGKTGGLLKGNIRKGAELTEAQRQALPQTGDQVPKKGINDAEMAPRAEIQPLLCFALKST